MILKLLGVALGTFAALAQSQSNPSARPQFDVASIKPAPPDEHGGGYRFEPGGRMIVSNFTLENLIMVAWHIQGFEVAGGSAWVHSERYDIQAKAEGNPGQDESRIMLQSLLAVRFHLALHSEKKEIPIYALVPAKRGGRLGAGLVMAKEGDCTPRPQDFPPPLEAGKPPYCGLTQQLRRQDNGVPLMQLQGSGVTLSMLARTLASTLNRHVTDDTGIGGSYDISVEYAPWDDSPATKSDNAVPSLFTALQEQLGLKLESRKGPVDVLVIDHAERPSAN